MIGVMVQRVLLNSDHHLSTSQRVLSFSQSSGQDSPSNWRIDVVECRQRSCSYPLRLLYPLPLVDVKMHEFPQGPGGGGREWKGWNLC